ncbi:MAG: hypothetical protein D3924_14935 [Candidatus Electrothrix sp. AR4]|nr:hypothetical protein [Candidatus Electrothrix sp. AR4]
MVPRGGDDCRFRAAPLLRSCFEQERTAEKANYDDEVGMRRTFLFFFVFFFCFSTISYSVSAKDMQKACGKNWITPLTEINGEITGIYYATPPLTRKEGLHLGVETASGEEVVIHVFPAKCIKGANKEVFSFQEGEEVTVSGSEFLTHREAQWNICAAAIPSHSLTDLRDWETGRINKEYCEREFKGDCDEKCRKKCRRKKKSKKCFKRCKRSCG